ncbi:ParB/RepB/Spo0J family partition protein [Lysinibacillus irui]|uniref:ParB/RepB/Spo0J family partition protein n=1 Tax=Lysinibacillus irui TaxID=2998077 RepID=A0ABU5NKC7_9BACI|nr:ParB/RepB/Spo0J family partition protein [Lysinibacillus irui]MEA0554763.1 ParB/RepB/Spo0J family partition protein [Lysinibacillus irui]MEA0976478.1 ParB/RepB/Spo0J family partition protein [Lysinibacillus irui]MEA1042632.1 ParB/RepB/Spo0J family partition protein [Lysinibacillus irui]
MKLTEIQANPHQPRKHFDEQALVELSQSIKVEGVMSPIMVRPIDGKYEIVQGERRFRAAQMAGLIEIPSIVREVDEHEAFHLAVIENIQREQMTPIEEAQAFMKYVEMGYTHEQIAKKVNKGRTFVTDRLRMLKLMPELQDWIAERRISHGHVTQLLKYEAILFKHIGRKGSEKAVQDLFYSYFVKSEKISVINVKEWGELMRFHFIAAIVGTFNGHGGSALWNEHRNMRSFCGDYHLHINSITREDIHFLLDWAINDAEPGTKKSVIYERYERLEEYIFDSGVNIEEVWESRDVRYLGEQTLEELEKSIREHMRTIMDCKRDMADAYRTAGVFDEADRLDAMSFDEYMEEFFERENVSRETIKQ